MTTGSLRLLLEDFLGLMKEEGELDAFLPLLFSSMGHEIIFRAQKGPRQYGVDIVSVGKDADGRKKLFLWLVKCGDIGRQEWNSGPQSVRQSIDDVGDVYLASHISPQHKPLPKKLIVLTNGDYLSSINQTLASFLSTWAARNQAEVDQVNGSSLAALVERHLLTEYVLPTGDRALLRRMLANVGTPELSVSVGRQLVNNLLARARTPAKSRGAHTKQVLTALRGIRTSLSVLLYWAQNEGNLRAPYRLAEYTILAVWGEFHGVLGQRGDVSQEFAELLSQLTAVADAFHHRLEPYYQTQNAFATVRPDSILVSETVFEELGRLGLQGCIWASLSVQGLGEVAAAMADVYRGRLRAILETHTCSRSPTYDHQSVDIHAALLLLLAVGDKDVAMQWVEEMAVRLGYAVKHRRHWPLIASFDEALAIHHESEVPALEHIRHTTFVPLLLLWTAVLGMGKVYEFLVTEVVTSLGSTTMNFWSPEQDFDAIVADGLALQAHGIGEGFLQVPAKPSDFIAQLAAPLAGAQPIANSAWYQFRAAYVPLLAALYWRLQVPRQMLAEQALALASQPNEP